MGNIKNQRKLIFFYYEKYENSERLCKKYKKYVTI